MSTSRFATASLAGAVMMFALGFLLYDLLLGAFFAANQGSVVGLMRDPPDIAHLALGQVAYGVLLTVVIGKWAGVSGAGAGFKVGALLGLMVGFGIDLTLFGVTNMANITATLVDPFVFATQMGCAGAVVGIVLARIK